MKPFNTKALRIAKVKTTLLKRLGYATLFVVLMLALPIFVAIGLPALSGLSLAAVVPVLVEAADDTVLGDGKEKKRFEDKVPGVHRVPGVIRGAANITTSLAKTYSLFGLNTASLPNWATNQDGTSGVLSDAEYFRVHAIRFVIANDSASFLDFLTAKQLLNGMVARFIQHRKTIWEGWLQSFVSNNIFVWNANAPADTVSAINPCVTVSLGRKGGFLIKKGEQFKMELDVPAVALPVAEATKWYVVCELLGEKGLSIN